MKTIIKIFVIPFLFAGFSSYAQDLSIVSGTTLKVLTGTNFYVNGLGLTPTNNPLALAGPMDISKSATPVGESIDRVYTFSSPITSFEGSMTYFYDEDELTATSAAENELVFRLKKGTTWTGDLIPFRDIDNDFLSINFGTPTSFSSVTASKPGITLSINKFNELAIEVYPNPTISTVTIKTELATETLIYSNLGQQLLKTNTKNIDISQFKSGTYLMIVKDTDSNNVNSYQLIKI